MSDEDNKIPTNEEIIDDLTKNLAKSSVQDDEVLSNSATIDPNEDPWENVGKDDEDKSETAGSVKKKQRLDFVDEEALKDRDVGLTGDEKEKLRSEAKELKNEGNFLFKTSEYLEATLKYTQALQTCPLEYSKDRSILYSNRAAAKDKYDERDSVIEDCTKAIELNPTYLKAYQRRARLYEHEDKLDESLADYRKIIELEPNHIEANSAVKRLPPLIEKKNEKLKQEMLGKLKDLGNVILKPFGLSTNNFKMEQDPATGGYSIKFNQDAS